MNERKRQTIEETDSGVECTPVAETRHGAGYYAVDSSNGNELCSGLSPETARQVAQSHADRLSEIVYLYEVGSDDEAEEIEPSA